MLKAGDSILIYVNQGWRQTTILGTSEHHAIAEYEMPNGTTSLRIFENREHYHLPCNLNLMPRDYRSIAYKSIPKKWLKAICQGEGDWYATPQQDKTDYPAPITLWERKYPDEPWYLPD